MVKLIGDKLPQLPFDERFRRMLPRELARMLEPSPIATRTDPSW
ncbi:hypothetical protein ACN9JG_21255 (plasmid) [Cereibacter azotoformans]